MQLIFTKMHALGNDFVIIESDEPPRSELISSLSNRRTGVGFDQLIWLSPALDPNTNIFYRIFNSDGSEAEQCGNGVRCIVRFIADQNPDIQQFHLGFSGGVVEGSIESNGDVAVSLGEPNFDTLSLPFDPQASNGNSGNQWKLDVADSLIDVELVSIGNPHAVMEVESIQTAPVKELGPLLESHSAFPNRANIGFMQIQNQSLVSLRVFERGAGETWACGTAACAAVAVGRRASKLSEEVEVQLPGGSLVVRWFGPGNSIWLVGEASTVYRGTVTI
ncbi:MAG: diaminopimelate epimerase [Pseudomonadota bacterium]|nr:diaminopimelate epimerase [Pseudomonadota bacterium]